MKIIKMKKAPKIEKSNQKNYPIIVTTEDDSLPMAVLDKSPVELENYNGLTPAIVFEKDSIYTIDGVESIPATPYQTLYDLNEKILSSLDPYIDIANAKAIIHPISNIMLSNVKMVFENFMNTIGSIYTVYVNRVQNIFTDESNKVEFFTFNSNYEYCIESAIINDFCDNFLRASDQDREKILQFGITNFIISYVNLIGTNIYNDTRAQLGLFFAGSSFSKPKDNKQSAVQFIMSLVDNNFYKMMADMTYEAGVFVQRFCDVSTSIYSNNIYDVYQKENPETEKIEFGTF